ncbi:MAG: hypothetical protein GDA45_03740 [Chromatiales bacterium]|nr:hypothetical protein [Chromatiales bacterium]
MKEQQLSRLKLIGVFFAYAGPLLIACVLYFGQHWFEFKSTARGDLVPSGQVLAATDFRPIKTAQGDHINSTPLLLDGRWLLFFNGTAACDLYCQANLFKIRQARLVLGRDAARVHTLYLTPEATLSPQLSDLLIKYPAFSVYQINEALHSSRSALKQNKIYIADPKGNLVLNYAADVYSRDIIKDFKRLLRASKIG